MPLKGAASPGDAAPAGRRGSRGPAVRAGRPGGPVTQAAAVHITTPGPFPKPTCYYETRAKNLYNVTPTRKPGRAAEDGKPRNGAKRPAGGVGQPGETRNARCEPGSG